MSPFPGDAIATRYNPAINHQAGAATCADDHAEHHAESDTGAVARLGQRKAVGVVGEPHRTA